MNGPQNGAAPPPHHNHHHHPPQHRATLSSGSAPMQSPDARAMPVPVAQSGPGGMNGNGFASGGHHMHRPSAPGGFEVSRSPPSNKNTSHVPCKFYLQGNCQAGKACPFKHSNEGLAQTEVCKYFQKGNCKYGRRCLLLHVLPDGQVVNGSTFGLSQYAQQSRQQNDRGFSDSQGFSVPTGVSPPGVGFLENGRSQQRPFENQVHAETGLSSHPGSPYGSPLNEGRMPISPTIKAISALDAPLPSSFDSQGISNYATYGPMGSSVPVRFGFTPLTSTSPTTSTVNSQAFGNLNRLARGDLNEKERVFSNNQLGSSPPSTVTPMTSTQPRRIMPVDRLQQHSNLVSSSLPMGNDPARYESDDEDPSAQEELLPSSLQDLFPDSRRRTSKDNDDAPSTRQSLSGFGSPNSSKVGSPSHASPPSRFHNFFKQRKEAEELGSSPFGHVGSPLRNSSLLQDPNSENKGLSGLASQRPWGSSDKTYITSQPRMGMLSQQFSQTRLDAGPSDVPPSQQLHSGAIRTPSGSSIGSALGGRIMGDRTVSTNSISKDRIDEEPFFSMEEDEEQREKEQKKRESQQFGPIGGQRKGPNPEPTSATSTDGSK